MGDKVFGRCRFSERVVLPCNWVFDGFCGGNGRVCRVEVIES